VWHFQLKVLIALSPVNESMS